MSKKSSKQIYNEYVIGRHPYSFIYYKYFDFDILKRVKPIGRGGKNHGETYNNVIIMVDTETSKEKPNTVCKNYVVAWTISIRAYHHNIVTLYGTKPSEVVAAMGSIICSMRGDKTIFFIQNLSYDWVFLRLFFMAAWGTPAHQLNTKPHYPVYVEFSNGIILRDSLILSQRSLEKWAVDMNVEHQKAVGYWDYDKIRDQNGRFNPFEKTYIEHDTLAGVECIDATMIALNKYIYSLPLTATGIPREAVRKLGQQNRAHEFFARTVPDYDFQLILEDVFHGGYTHNNRHYIERIVEGDIKAYDFASSYPYCMLAYKYPMEKFAKFDDCTIDFILDNADDYAYVFKLVIVKPRLKNDFIAMPALQKSKAKKVVNSVDDNGRILCAEYVEIWLNEVDLEVINSQYDYDFAVCVNVYYAYKNYLPKWFTDYVYECFVAKCKLKGGDKVLYSIAKSKLNALYGMTVQKCVKPVIDEVYETGDFQLNNEQDPREMYDKYKSSRRSVLLYQWGVWVTSYAFRNLFTLGSCVDSDNGGVWLYSDTDSCYAINWNTEKIEAYNASCKQRLLERGYGAVLHNNREYWLGVAELDGSYCEFVSVGAKRYACRDINGTLKITVAGVPKAGVNCLNNDIRNFRSGMIFDGETTGKKQHTYFFENEIYIDEKGNERGDSIDLSPASYLLDSVQYFDWEKIFQEEIEVINYDEKVL